MKFMAWTKAKTVAGGVALLLAAATGMVVVKNNFFDTHEPSYQGRRLSEWLPDLAFQQPPEQRAQAGEAMRKMGKKTLPFLLADLAMVQDPGSRKAHYIVPDKRSADERSGQAAWAFDALGSLGKPAIPQINQLLEQNPGYAPLALGGLAGMPCLTCCGH